MLASLSIRDVVLIDRLDLAFEPGLSVLTGETGAGKSILLDALGLALGARGDSALVRHGAAQASVVAAFDLPPDHAARRIAADQGIAQEEDGLLILRRTLGSDGRGRAFVNDQPASVALFRRIGESLVEIEGQFGSQGLLDPATHHALLDAVAGAEDAADHTRFAWEAWRTASEARARAEADAAQARADEDYLRHAAGELDGLDPRAGEEAELAELRQRLMNREKIAEALTGAAAEMSGERGAERALNSARRHLERLAGKGGERADAALVALDRAAAEAADAAAELSAATADLDLDPRRLEEAEERLFALRELARKHRTEVDRLPELREAIAVRLAAIDDGSATLARLAREEAEARTTYIGAAERLGGLRAKAAERLDRKVTTELKPLKLDKAKFHTSIAPLPGERWGPGGTQSVAFEVATNPGAPLAPLTRVASGGELARLMLALKVALAERHPVPTLVFDEVDSGIGGATAAAVGERLQRLASSVQVLVVTHSPQVAALGLHHWRVTKETEREGAITRIHKLDPVERREEIARMLSAAEITAEARAQAERLIGASKIVAS